MENFPTKIFPKGQSVEILTDFRAVFQWNKMVSSEYLTPYEKSIGTVHLFCKTAIPKFLYNDALTEILKFIQCGESVDEIEPAEEKTIDFEKDYSLLWSAFDQCYQIDLNHAKMHWWAFKFRFDELPDHCKIKQVMQIRTMQPDPSAMSTKDFHNLMMLKEKYYLE